MVNEDRAIAFLKKSVSPKLHMHMSGQTAAEMFKALAPKTHVLDSLNTFQSLCSTMSHNSPTAEEMLEEIKKLHEDLQKSVTETDIR